ncbi:MAG: hypothetical protein ACFCU1_05775 [Sumerlaeia bacterium]
MEPSAAETTRSAGSTPSAFIRPERKFSRSFGWNLFWVGLAGLLAGILLLVMIQSGNPLLEELKTNKSIKFLIMGSTIVSWIIWKVGKTIIKLHDQDDINEYRHNQKSSAVDSNSKVISTSHT